MSLPTTSAAPRTPRPTSAPFHDELQRQQQQQFRASPAKAKQHYSHLNYAHRRRKDIELEQEQLLLASSPAAAKRDGEKQSEAAAVREERQQQRQQKPPELPRLKTICGYAISEDGQLMSRFVSPPRFGANNLDRGGVQKGVGGVAQVLAPGLMASPQRVFTATVTAGEGGVPRISIPLQAARRINSSNPASRKWGGQANAANDSWSLLVEACAEDGLEEDDVALLEWGTVLKLLKHYNIVAPATTATTSSSDGADAVPVQAINDPIEKARCELIWRRKHDRVVFAAATAAQQREEQFHKKAAQSKKHAAAAAYNEELLKSAAEFKLLVDRLYPPPPIMQAAGGPVLLVRTAPQGEIHVSETMNSSASPRSPGDAQVYSPIVHLRKADVSVLMAEGGGATGTTAVPTMYFHHRETSPKPFSVRHYAAGPQSSPLRNPAIRTAMTPPPGAKHWSRR